MRPILLLVMLIMLGFTAIGQEAKMGSVVEGGNRFALDLYGKLKGQPGNLFFSPRSISTALAMTYGGARGKTAEQMARVLRFPESQDALHEAFAASDNTLRQQAERSGCRLNLANRLWGQQSSHFLPDFLALTRDHYHAELAQVDFAGNAELVRTQINKWVEEQTADKIRDLVPPGVLTPLTRLVLTNAIYFHGSWSKPFTEALTTEDNFQVTSDKTTRAPLMHKIDDFRFFAGDGLKVLELPYGKGEFSAAVLLPDEVDGLPDLEGRLGSENLNKWLTSAGSRKVEVFLPRYTLTSAFSLSQTLGDMGMPLAFDLDRADFSGISTDEKLFISEVLHKAFVDVNEKGTEAAAATGVVVSVLAAVVQIKPVVFRADHPFLFLILDSRNRSILFMGRVVNPRA
jgi:serpin B